MNVSSFIADIFFPKICLGCGRLGSYFCPVCSSRIQIIELTICPVCTKPSVGGMTHPRCKTRYVPEGLTSVFRYDHAIRKALKLLKYRRVTDLTDHLVELLSHTVGLNKVEYQPFLQYLKLKPTIVPIPLYKSRKRERWFNQSELIGKSLAKKWNLSFEPSILIKIKQTRPQAGLQRDERLKNIKGAFEINSSFKLHVTSYKNVILIDDVWTTGATMRECVNVLTRGGVKNVWCLTVAR